MGRQQMGLDGQHDAVEADRRDEPAALPVVPLERLYGMLFTEVLPVRERLMHRMNE